MNAPCRTLLQLVLYTNLTGKNAIGCTDSTEKITQHIQIFIKSSQKCHKMTKTCMQITYSPWT